jgi:2-alkyl-3-oxoalkanoate reductase
MKIFVPGAVGLPLVRPLCTLGHQATGITRAGPGVDRLRGLWRLGRCLRSRTGHPDVTPPFADV